MLQNDTCDIECMFKFCNFDNNACGGEVWNSDHTCHISMIDNNIWDEDCEFEADCNFDGLDCANYVYVEGSAV